MMTNVLSFQYGSVPLVFKGFKSAPSVACMLHEESGMLSVLLQALAVVFLPHGLNCVFIFTGNNKLGGQDFSQRLFQYASERVHQRFGVSPTLKEDVHRLRQAIEGAKLRLTVESHVTLKVPLHLQTTGAEGQQEEHVTFQEELTRELFEDLNADLFQKILAPIETVLIEGRLDKDEIDEIVLVGGSTRIPRIRQIISQYFGKKPNTSVDPDLAVVTGVALQAGIMGGSWPLQVSAIEIPNKNLRKTNFS